MNRKTIGFDCDDVLALHARAWVAHSNKHYGTKLRTEDYSDHWHEAWNVEIEERERRALAWFATEPHLDFEVMPHAQEVLSRLSENFDLVIVTSRQKQLVEGSHIWIQRHFPDIFKDVHFVPIWEPDNTVTKADICRLHGIDYLVDDVATHCNLAAAAGIPAILYGDYKHNRDAEIEQNVIRIPDMLTLESYFMARLTVHGGKQQGRKVYEARR